MPDPKKVSNVVGEYSNANTIGNAIANNGLVTTTTASLTSNAGIWSNGQLSDNLTFTDTRTSFGTIGTITTGANTNTIGIVSGTTNFITYNSATLPIFGYKLFYGEGKEFYINSVKGNFFINKKDKKVLMCDNDGSWKYVDIKSFNITLKRKDYISNLKIKKEKRTLLCEKIKKKEIDFDYTFFNANGFLNFIGGYNGIAVGTSALYNSNYFSGTYLDAKTLGMSSDNGDLFINSSDKIAYKFEKDEWVGYEIESVEFELTIEKNIEEFKKEKKERILLSEKIKKSKIDKYNYEFNRPYSFVGGGQGFVGHIVTGGYNTLATVNFIPRTSGVSFMSTNRTNTASSNYSTVVSEIVDGSGTNAYGICKNGLITSNTTANLNHLTIV